jgi:hypothetical protein
MFYRWRITHVLPEAIERFPFIANVDPFSTVFGIDLLDRIGTPLDHTLPAVINTRITHPMALARFRSGGAAIAPLSLYAAAGFSVL